MLALPGLTSTHAVWRHIAAKVRPMRFVAPDLRGRGGSWQLGGATGLAQHGRDVAALADELDLRDVVLVGHSMGAFLAPVVARQLGGRVARLVLIDGGIPPKLPFVMRKPVVKLVFGAAARRAGRAWPDAAAYADATLGRAIKARPELRDDIVGWCEYELDGGSRPRLDRATIVADAVDTFFGAEVVPALDALTVPAHLLAATAGKDDRAAPFFSDAVLDTWTARVPSLTTERVIANHVTILFTPEVTAAIRD